MKRLLLIVMAVGALNFAHAQEESSVAENIYKAQGGDWNAELNFSPFSSSPVNLSYIRLRKFSSATKAMRLGVNLGYENKTPDEFLTQSELNLNLRPGIEKHFGGTDRLSPYIGGELDIALKSVKEVQDEDSDNSISAYTRKGAWSGSGNRGFFRMGMNFIVGADYYIAKKLYIGTEFGYGFEVVNTSDIKVEVDGTDPDDVKGGSAFQLGSNFNSSLRLGFVF
jgi:hypothetical protein